MPDWTLMEHFKFLCSFSFVKVKNVIVRSGILIMQQALCKKVPDRPSMENRNSSFSFLRPLFFIRKFDPFSFYTPYSRIVTVLSELSNFIPPVILPQRPIYWMDISKSFPFERTTAF